MLDFSRVQNYYIACGYTDMRKQIDGLAALVQTQFGQEMRIEKPSENFRFQTICGGA